MVATLPLLRSRSVTQRALYAFAILGCGLWLAGLLIAPIAADRGRAIAPVLYAFYDTVCHQIPERSFRTAGEPLAVCHRCTGLYVGFLLGLIAVPRWHRMRRWLLDKPARVVAFSLPLALDWSLTINTPASRFVTGLLAAAPVAVLLWAALGQLTSTDTEPVLEGET